MAGDEFTLDWELVSGREDANGDPDPEQRYRIYRMCPDSDELELLGCCPSEAAVGVALCTWGREGEFDHENGDCAHGCLDTFGEPGKRWLWRPWLASPKNVSDAGRMMRRAQS